MSWPQDKEFNINLNEENSHNNVIVYDETKSKNFGNGKWFLEVTFL